MVGYGATIKMLVFGSYMDNLEKSTMCFSCRSKSAMFMVAFAVMVGVFAICGNLTTVQARERVAGSAASNPNLVEQTVSPKNATINLFDYWLVTEEAPDNADPDNYASIGINEGHQLRFCDAGRHEASNKNSINAWTGQSGRPFFGIVKPLLGEDGYPVLKAGNIYQVQGGLKTSEESLSYLFDASDERGKRSYSDVKGLVQMVDGYYTYDSKKNFAIFDSERNAFDVYKKPAVKAATGTNQIGQFLPFNTEEEVFDKQPDGSLVAKNSINAKHEVINHYFGLDLTADFTQPKNGEVNGKNMKFSFSGDDDVWVFIDGVLVGDLGGVHGAASLDIDFKTGKIVLQDARTNPPATWPGKETTLRSCFTDALGEAAAAEYFEGDTSTFKPDSYHTLKFFYMERGNTDSNMKISFNLQRVTQSSVRKDDQYGKPVQGAELALYEATKVEDGGKVRFEPKGDSPIWQGLTDAAGNFNIMTPAGNRPYNFAEAHGHGQDHYILREVKAPAGYRKNPDAWLSYHPSHGDGQDGFVVCENPWDSGVYARPNQSVYVTGESVRDTTGASYRVTEENTVLAVLYKRDRQHHDDWHAIGGEHGAWKVKEEGMVDISQLNGLVRDGFAHVFTFENDSWMTDMGDLPGTPDDYRFMAAQDKDVDYSIAYYLVDKSYADIRSAIDAGKNPITAENARLLDSTGKMGNFTRKSYATLHITDTKNDLVVQKVDDAGEPIRGVTFQLFRTDQMKAVGQEGSLAPRPGEIPVMEETTSDLSARPEVALDGAVLFEGIAKRDGVQTSTYYVVEKETPKGYTGSVEPIRVIVDNTGVYADAATQGDGVVVSAGVGTLIDSMNHYGSNDGVEVTLHDIIAHLQVGSCEAEQDPSSYHVEWSDAAGDQEQKDLFLRYDDVSRFHEYMQNPYKPKNGTRFVTDEGIIRASIKQDPEPYKDDYGIGTWEDLGDRDLTNLYTGSTVVRVTNQREASLEVEKRVTIPNGLTGPDDWKQKDFTFKFEFTKNGAPLDGEYDARVFGEDGQQRGDDFKISHNGTHTLKHGETMKVYGLPDGSHYKVSEPASDMPHAFIQTLPVGEGGNPLSPEGEVRVGSPAHELFENTYRPSAAMLASTTLKVAKQFVDENGDAAWELGFTVKPSFEFILEAPTGTPMPAGAVEGVDGDKRVTRSSVTIDGADKDEKYSDSFGSITYTAPGTYRYVLYEKTPAPEDRIPGISYSDAAYRLTVVVEDNKQGKLEPHVTLTQHANDLGEPVGDGAGGAPIDPVDGVYTATYSNVFDLAEVYAGPLASKHLSGRDFAVEPSARGEFAFRMVPVGEHAEDQPMPEDCQGTGANRYTEVRNKASSVAFGQSKYTHKHLNAPDGRSGSFEYELFEVVPDDAVNEEGIRWSDATGEQRFAGGFKYQGVTYDSTRYIAHVALSLANPQVKRGGGEDALVAVITYSKVLRFDENGSWTGDPDDLEEIPPSESGANRVEFHNSYAATGSAAGIKIAKTLHGRDMNEGEFSFKIEGANPRSAALLPEGSSILSAPAGPEGVKVEVGRGLQIAFDQSHAGDVYTFYIREVTPWQGGSHVPGMVGGWDNSIYRLEYRVTDNLDGTLRVVPSLYLVYDSAGAMVNRRLDVESYTDETGVIALDFENRYRTRTTYAGITVTKTMHGKDLEAKRFGFTLEAGDDKSAKKMTDRNLTLDEMEQERSFSAPSAEMDVPAVMDKLSGLTFTLDDACDHGVTGDACAFTYYVSENVDPAWDDNKNPTDGVQSEGVTYDRSKFKISIVPIDDGKGTLKTITTVYRLTDKLTGDELDVPEEIGTWDSSAPETGAPEKPTVPFENSYNLQPGVVSFDKLTKELDGREWGASDEFVFEFHQELYKKGNATYKPGDPGFVEVRIPNAVVNSHTPLDESGFKRFGFSNVSYAVPGIYRYSVREQIPLDAVNGEGVAYGEATAEQKAAGGFSKDGVTYSSKSYEFTITALDTTTGKIAVIPPIFAAEPAPGEPYFTNAAQRVSVDLRAQKVLTGRPLDAEEFSFELVPVDNGLSATAGHASIVSKNDAEGNIVFPGLIYEKPGRYEYTLREVRETSPENGITYDDSEYTVIVNVTTTPSGALKADVSVFDENRNPVQGDPVFTNTYGSTVDYSALGGLVLTKQLNGRDMTAGQFEFTIEAQGDDDAAKRAAAEKLGFEQGQLSRTFASHAAGDGVVDRIDLLQGLEDGLVFTQEDADSTFSYRVSESKGGGSGYVNDQTVYLVSMAVEDDGAGVLTVTTTVTTEGAPSAVKTYIYKSGQTPEQVEQIILPFANSYSAKGSVPLAVTKRMNGRPLADGEFTFQLKAGDTVVAEARNTADGVVDFGAIEYTIETLKQAEKDGYAKRDAAGVWKVEYTAVETTEGLPDGVSATTQSFPVVVSVKDDGAGTLDATIGDLAGSAFVNTYAANSVPMSLRGLKKLDREEGLTPDDIAGKFTFTVTGEDGAPMPERREVVNAADGLVDFGLICFTLDDLNRKWEQMNPGGSQSDEQGLVDASSDSENAEDGSNVSNASEMSSAASEAAAGRVGAERSVTFEYVVTEKGAAPGVTNDETTSHTVRYTVTDDGAGHLTATCDMKDGIAFTFVNSYTVEGITTSVTDQIKISKELVGKPLTEGAFTFKLVPVAEGGSGEDAQVVTAECGIDGSIVFPAITYTKPGVYEYKLFEVADGTQPGVVFDDSIYTVRTTVVDNGDGTMSAAHTVLDHSEKPVDEVVFANAYAPSDITVPLTAAKELVGRDLRDGEFSFELLREDGTVVQTVANDSFGNVVFKPLKITAEDLRFAAWEDHGGSPVRSVELTYHVREVVPQDAVNAAGVYWKDADEAQRAAGGFRKDHVIYDGRVFAVHVLVTDSGDGALQAEVTWDESPVFRNEFKHAAPVGPDAQGTKPGEPATNPGNRDEDPLPATADSRGSLLVFAIGCVVLLCAIRLRSPRRG